MNDLIQSIPLLQDRERKECMLSVRYIEDLNHGTSGHMSYLTIYKLLQEIRRLHEVNTANLVTVREQIRAIKTVEALEFIEEKMNAY